jgi:transposase
MVREGVRFRLRAVKQHIDGSVRTEDICRVFGISERTLRGWCRRYGEEGVEGLRCRPRRPDGIPSQTPARIEDRILRMRRRHPSWGAKRIQAYLAREGADIHWTTVHRVLRRNGFMVRVRRKPKPSKRFQRHHADSLGQLDVYAFRTADVGKVYVFQHPGRQVAIPRDVARVQEEEGGGGGKLPLVGHPRREEAGGDLCRQRDMLHSQDFKRFCGEQGIRIIYGRPYNPRGRGKPKRFHGILFMELISQKRFRSLPHFRRGLWLYRQSYNRGRLHGWIEWAIPRRGLQRQKSHEEEARLGSGGGNMSCNLQPLQLYITKSIKIVAATDPNRRNLHKKTIYVLDGVRFMISVHIDNGLRA